MELWLSLAILSQLCYAIATSLDKRIMNKGSNPAKTAIIRNSLNSIILLIAGILFFKLSITVSSLAWSALLGILYGGATILYFYILKKKDLQEAIPFLHSGTILLVFIFSLILFNESANILNYLGVFIILLGIHLLLSKNKLKLPKLDKPLIMLFIAILLLSIYWLLTKNFLFEIEPINLVIPMFLFSAITMALAFPKLNSISSMAVNSKITNKKSIFAASLFGSLATILIYFALSIGDSSKVNPLIGLQLAFIFFIGLVFFKERPHVNRIIGTIFIILGTYFIYAG